MCKSVYQLLLVNGSIAIFFSIIKVGANCLLSTLYTLIQESYNKIFKKNCLQCKHCYLADVASCGDGCRYKCMKHKYETLNQRMISSNCRTLYKKCNDYERKT